MNIEEKAKAYDEVRKKIALRFGSNVVEEIFSEFEMSKDEKIRKELHIYLDWLDGRKDHAPRGEYTIRDMIAWLEKQSEQPRYSIGDVLCDKSCTTLNKDTQPNFEIIDIRDGVYICDKGSFPISQQDEYELVAKKIEQNHEDETSIAIKNEEAYKIGFSDGEAHAKEEMELSWSEEDERILQCLIRDQEKALDDVRNDKYGHSEIISDLKEMYRERIDWLKQLKQRHTWKPSKGQLECLDVAIDKVGKDHSPFFTNRAYLTLKALKEQLKKLTE